SGEERHTIRAIYGLRSIARIIHLFGGYSAPIYIGGLLVAWVITGNHHLTGWLLIPIGVIALIAIRNFVGLGIVAVYLLVIVATFNVDFGAYSYAPLFLGVVLLTQGLKDVVQVAWFVFAWES